MQPGNIGSTAVITSRYLKEKNGEKHFREKQEKRCLANSEEPEYRTRRAAKRKE